MTAIKSLFLDTVKELPPEKMPSKIPKLEKKGGKYVWGSKERKAKK